MPSVTASVVSSAIDVIQILRETLLSFLHQLAHASGGLHGIGSREVDRGR